MDKLKMAHEIVCLLDEGDEDKIEILENELDINSLFNWALRKYQEDLTVAAANKELASIYSGRASRFTNRSENMKELVYKMLTSIDEKSFKADFGTASIKDVAPKVVVNDITLLPKDCIKVVKSPIMDKVKELYNSGTTQGLSKTNGKQTIQIRIK